MTDEARETFEPDLDDLPRTQLCEGPLGDMPGDVAWVLDEWLFEKHGIASGHHYVGSFLGALADRGYRVTRIDPGPPIGELLPPATD
jgi:hypothetical protein